MAIEMAPEFFQSHSPEPHAARTKAILAAHPQVRGLIGANPWTAVLMLAIVALQTGIAYVMGRLGMGYWWLSLLLAYGIGAFASHCLFVIIHEASHNLVLRKRSLDKTIGIIADLPNIIPSAMGFRGYHLMHHARQGDYLADADLPSEWEARLVGNSFIGKALWLFFFPVFQLTRVLRVHGVSISDRWALLNYVASISYALFVLFVFGGGGVFYLACSFWFSIGLHPLGARWIQEHFTIDPVQETASYYGPLNVLALNVGYHNEHHDFPSVPWNRLPQVKAMAPEFYVPLQAHQSWGALLMTFLRDPRYSLHSRVLRILPERGGKGPA